MEHPSAPPTPIRCFWPRAATHWLPQASRALRRTFVKGGFAMTTKGKALATEWFAPRFSLGLVLLVGGCGVDSEPAGPGTSDAERIEDADSVAVPRLRWVGVIEETDVRVAFLVGTGKARLYF